MTVINLDGVQVIFDGVASATPIRVSGRGSRYMAVCSGTVGQTSKLQGSIDGIKWIDIVDFTIESSITPLSEPLEFYYPLLQVTGTATLKIARGNHS